MKSFLAACGIEDSFQFTVENRDGTESRLRLLYQPFAVIGRDLRADVVLDHPDVSRRHVYLQVIDGRVFWIDLESRTGTRGERETQRFGWLEGRRTFCVGPYVVRRRAGDDQQATSKNDRPSLPRDTPLVARPWTVGAQFEVALEFLNGPSQSMLKPAHRVLSLIGSASGCKFRLTDPSVSRFHGSLLQTSTGLWIIDLLGQKGITINDVPVRCSRLVEGDIVRIGRYEIRVRCRPRAQESHAGFSDHRDPIAVPKAARQRRTPAGPNSVRRPSPTPQSGSESGYAQELPSSRADTISTPARIDVLPSTSFFPVTLRQSELTESMLVPLVNQFGLMQQQMFDQFQQAMSMMVQMFGTMHRDQMEVIRAELDRLRELTDEFHALKNELAERTRENSAPKEIEPEVGSAGRDQLTGMNLNTPVSPQAFMGLKHRSGASAAGRAPLSSPQPPRSGGRGGGPEESLERESLSSRSSSRSAASSSVTESTLKTNREASEKSSSKSSEPAAERDTVLWLHQRIMALQNERETRWQKILKLMPRLS
jgi:pSer/pThr/pTyr-binding forkhead associated (FHA) protein